MTHTPDGFEEFMIGRSCAACGHVAADPGPLLGISTIRHPATSFGPQGGPLHGAAEVKSTPTTPPLLTRWSFETMTLDLPQPEHNPSERSQASPIDAER